MMKKLESPPSGEELKEIRLLYGLTQKEMEELLGLTGLIVDYQHGISKRVKGFM